MFKIIGLVNKYYKENKSSNLGYNLFIWLNPHSQHSRFGDLKSKYKKLRRFYELNIKMSKNDLFVDKTPTDDLNN